MATANTTSPATKSKTSSSSTRFRYCRRQPSGDEPLFVTSNCPTHGQGREEVKNVLGVFTPAKNDEFVSNKIKTIEPSINAVPETLTFRVKNSQFETLEDFEGFLIAEVSGPKKGPGVE